jgi:glycosyltransferase involved in cell wall biosynthesis
MTILITLENPERTGAPRMALEYARALVSAGHRVLVASGPPSDGASSILPDLKAAGAEVLRVPSLTPFSAATLLRRLRALIRREGVTCVLGSQQRDRVLACLVAGLTGTRCVIFAQSRHVFRGPAASRRAKEWTYRWALRRQADLVICVSEAVEQEIRGRFRVDPTRTSVVANGIDVRAFPSFDRVSAHDVRRQLGLSDEDRLLLNVGRIDRQKGQDLLLEAFGAVAQRHPRARLVVVGAVGRSSAAGEARRLEDRLRSIVRADLYVHAARWEGPALCLAVLEAMAAGLPVISSDCSGRPDGFVDGEHGWIVPTGDVPALQAALDRALATDLPELSRMGGRARLLVERHYDVRRLGERFVELVEGVAAP